MKIVYPSEQIITTRKLFEDDELVQSDVVQICKEDIDHDCIRLGLKELDLREAMLAY